MEHFLPISHGLNVAQKNISKVTAEQAEKLAAAFMAETGAKADECELIVTQLKGHRGVRIFFQKIKQTGGSQGGQHEPSSN